MNKRGWLKIIEASLAIVIIIGILFTLYANTISGTDTDLTPTARDILREISINSTLRNIILSSDNTPEELIFNVAKLIPQENINFEIKVCNMNDVCGKSNYTPGDIYSAERIISATIENQNYNPKKIRLFLWRE